MSVAVLGEALIDFIPGDDGAYRPHLGGSPFNVAIALARQNIDVAYLSPLSDDHFGELLHSALQREQVAMPITRRSRWPTSLAIVALDKGGAPSYRLYREGIADKDTTLDELIAAIPPETQVFHTGSLAITPSQIPKITALVQELRQRDVLIAIDLNIRLGASIDAARYLAGVRSLLPLADIVKASDEDLEPFDFAPTPRAAAEMAYAEMDGGVLVLTEGRGGAAVFSSEGLLARPACDAGPLVDTIGAGDTFHANFVAALLRSGALNRPLSEMSHWQSRDAVDHACTAAAINVTRAGCQPPTPSEVEALLAKAKRGDT